MFLVTLRKVLRTTNVSVRGHPDLTPGVRSKGGQIVKTKLDFSVLRKTKL